jgi:hypothetical protein
MAIGVRFCVIGLLLVHGCGGSSPAAPATKTPEPSVSPLAERHPTQPLAPGQGSSDGTTCEQARESYTEEVSIGGRGQADLSADDFAAVLNRGTYLEPCALPSSSKLRICAAIQNGQAVGVTVAADPAAPDVEVCIAKEVRKLPFPAHAKMDVVNVQF